MTSLIFSSSLQGRALSTPSQTVRWMIVGLFPAEKHLSGMLMRGRQPCRPAKAMRRFGHCTNLARPWQHWAMDIPITSRRTSQRANHAPREICYFIVHGLR
jgi:hypothetical protein